MGKRVAWRNVFVVFHCSVSGSLVLSSHTYT